jgi:cellulose synthase/poly-beta-1,6-N-acetylglucosamine synthase-like glycosyltransferase
VVDDGSTDRTAELATGAFAQVLSIGNQGKARALQAGIKHFNLLERYDWIGVLDADSQLDQHYLMAMDCGAKRYPDASILCGAPRSAPANWLTAYRAVEYAMSLGIYREAQHMIGTINVAPGCASMYRSELMQLLDFSEDTLVEDMDLTIQAQRMGRQIVFLPDARVVTQDPRTMRGYIGQVARWYRGTFQVIRKHKIGRKPRLIDLEIISLMTDALLFVVTLLALPWLGWHHPLALAVGVLLDQTVMFVFTVLVARRERRLDVLWAFPLFLIPRLASAAVFGWAFVTTRRQSRVGSWYHVARY